MSERCNYAHRFEFEILRYRDRHVIHILAPGLHAPDGLRCAHWSRINLRGESDDKVESLALLPHCLNLITFVVQ
jgi:hypothetical protein